MWVYHYDFHARQILRFLFENDVISCIKLLRLNLPQSRIRRRLISQRDSKNARLSVLVYLDDYSNLELACHLFAFVVQFCRRILLAIMRIRLKYQPSKLNNWCCPTHAVAILVLFVATSNPKESERKAILSDSPARD